MLLFLVVSSSCQSLSVKGVGGLGFIILGILGVLDGLAPYLLPSLAFLIIP